MPKAKTKVSFTKCIQNSQDYGSTDEHMVSRLFFDLAIGDKRHSGLCVDIKQAVVGDFEKAPHPRGWKPTPPHNPPGLYAVNAALGCFANGIDDSLTSNPMTYE